MKDSAEIAAPSGIVAFLFTDIEGSTRRWEADPRAMRTALAAHDEVLRDAVEQHDGWLFKHTGDGICAAFASPQAAVEAGVAAQLGLRLPVRMGIATGQAELSGGDYFGAVLNRAARVMAAGHGGQILLDGLTAGLLTGVDLMALGSRRLRDISAPVEMFQIRAAGLPTDFPPLTTTDACPGNLRPPTTSFVGREAELAELQAALRAHRLVTLTGVGGVGKTRMALEVCARSVDDFPDGVWVIELAAVGSPASLPDAVAATLGITHQPWMTVSDSVAAALEGRSRLLVFDNCEHVLDAAADMIETILSRSSTVNVLATSREGLRLAEEQLWPVPSLVHSGVDSAAARLFTERAQAVAPDVSLSGSADAAAVAEICRRLDGIPLAIELAASRVLSMSVAEIRDRLDDRLRLLVGSRRGLERHHTLRHAVRWSYDLLDDDERRLLTRCSVFAGGFDLDSCRAVAGSDDDFATLHLLDALVRKSLLVADRSSMPTRFSMLETIRQFAGEQLALAGHADQARAAHARFFAGREGEVLGLWDSPRQRAAYDWFNLELPNLRAAFHWAADHGDLDTAAPIACYATIIGLCAEQYEPIAWAEELITPAQGTEHRRLAQLYVAAAQCYVTGRVDEAIGYIESGRPVIESGRFDEIPCDFDAAFTGAYNMKAEPGHAAAWLRSLIARGPGTQLVARACLVLSLNNAGAYDEARATAAGLPAAAETAENPNTKALALTAYGWAYRDAEPAVAYDVLRRALKIAHDSGSRYTESVAAIGLSRMAGSRGDPQEAFDSLVLAIRNYRDAGSFSLMQGPLAMLATFFDRLGHHEPAATIFGFVDNRITTQAFPETGTAMAHLRTVLGGRAYEALARSGEGMTNAEMATYALDQIELIRAGLADQNAPG